MVLKKSGKQEYLGKNISKQREQQETQPTWMIDLVFRDTHKNIAAAEVFDPGLSGHDAQVPTKTRVVGGF